ncbi:MAG: DUF1062 domain-containing protein [Myxococcota bacterium]
MSDPIHWTITPLATPVVYRKCARCDERTVFRSSDKFRVNGSGRKLDVWLIYKCEQCNQTWNATLLSRVSPESIAPELYQAFMDNDEATAWRYAFDFGMLKQNEAEPDPKVDTRIDGPELDFSADLPSPLRIVIDTPVSSGLRLEALLASRLGVSRRQLGLLYDGGKLRVRPEHKEPLSRRIKARVEVELDTPALMAARRAAE